MKVLLINNYPYCKGDAEVIFLNTINLLNLKRHQVISISKNLGNSYKENIDYLTPKETFFFNRFYSSQTEKIVHSILKEQNPDITYTYDIAGGISFFILPEIRKINIPKYYSEISNRTFVIYNFIQKFDPSIYRINYFLFFEKYDHTKGVLTIIATFQSKGGPQLVLAGRSPIENI